MSYTASFETFAHIMKSAGVRSESAKVQEGVLRDAFEHFVLSPLNELEFAAKMKTDRPDWFGPPKPDVDAENEVLFSAQAQSAFVRAHSVEELAEILARSGLKVGQVLKRKAVTTMDENSSSNPYSDQYKGTAAQKEAAIIGLINSNVTLATSLAKSAGKTITGEKIR